MSLCQSTLSVHTRWLATLLAFKSRPNHMTAGAELAGLSCKCVFSPPLMQHFTRSTTWILQKQWVFSYVVATRIARTGHHVRSHDPNKTMKPHVGGCNALLHAVGAELAQGTRQQAHPCRDSSTKCKSCTCPPGFLGHCCWPEVLDRAQDQGTCNSCLSCLCMMQCIIGPACHRLWQLHVYRAD
jgi:hypothetical protein